MSNVSLARSYFQKARKRLRALGTLFEEAAAALDDARFVVGLLDAFPAHE